MQLTVGPALQLERCHHCGTARPTLKLSHVLNTEDADGGAAKSWFLYPCTTCGGVHLVVTPQGYPEALEIWPKQQAVDLAVPSRARNYLRQAMNSLGAPDGSVMLTASALDAMLKDKGYAEGSLHARINQAAEAHLITADMATWAHEIRLDANSPRHADVDDPHATHDDAQRVLAFALALAEFLYVLPARVRQRGGKDEQQRADPRRSMAPRPLEPVTLSARGKSGGT